MNGLARAIGIACLAGILASCGGKHPPSPPRRSESTPPSARPGKIFQKGQASWYGPGFHGKRTASGEVYDQDAPTAAHRTLPFHTWVEVHNLDNGRRTRVRVNDRGPFIRGRIIDLSRGAARAIDMERAGVARVELRLLGQAPGPPAGGRQDTPPPVMRPVEPESGPFDVQVGAFAVADNAYRLRQRLRRDWPAVHVVRFHEFYRVRVGPLDGERAAEQAAGRLRRDGYEGWVIRHDPEEEQP